MPAGTTFEKCSVSPVVCRPLEFFAGECRRKYMVKRVRLPFRVCLQKVDREALVIDCRQFGCLRRMQEELHGHRGTRFDSGLR